MDHHRCRSIDEPRRRQDNCQGNDRLLPIFSRSQNQQQQQGNQRAREQLRECASPVHNHQVIGTRGIQTRGKDRVAPAEPPACQKKHGRSRRDQHEPNVDAGSYSPGENRTESGSQHPRRGRIENETRLTIREVRQRSPPRIEDPLLPLRENLQPGIQMEFNVVAGGQAEKEKRNFDGEGGRTDRDQRRPE